VYIIVWEFRVPDDVSQKFIERYGSCGDWAKLFGRTEGYLGTELMRSVKDPMVFFTLDAWKSKASYDDFHAAFADEYRALDRSFEGLTEHEQLIGTITSEQTRMPGDERGK
jgi:heme-degrading monooxygenase HmoA